MTRDTQVALSSCTKPIGGVLALRLVELGVLTLNRPKAINALDVSMMDAVPAVLDAWRSDESVRAVALVGAGEAVADRISEGDVDIDTAADVDAE